MTINLRPVQKDDWDFILFLRNEKDVRDACHDTSMISKDNHYHYMEKISFDSNCFQWIVTFNGIDIGHAKIVHNEFGYMIKKDFRGKGLAILIYEQIFLKLQELKINKIHITIKIGYDIPLKVALKVGFEQKKIISKDNKPYCYYLEKEL